MRKTEQMRRKTERMQRAKLRSKAEEMVVGTLNVHTFAYKGTNGVGRNSTAVLQLRDEANCDVIGLQETLRAIEAAFLI